MINDALKHVKKLGTPSQKLLFINRKYMSCTMIDHVITIPIYGYSNRKKHKEKIREKLFSLFFLIKSKMENVKLANFTCTIV